jgi:hypothetical protein
MILCAFSFFILGSLHLSPPPGVPAGPRKRPIPFYKARSEAVFLTPSQFVVNLERYVDFMACTREGIPTRGTALLLVHSYTHHTFPRAHPTYRTRIPRVIFPGLPSHARLPLDAQRQSLLRTSIRLLEVLGDTRMRVSCKIQLLNQIYAMLIIWIFPQGCRAPRDNPHIRTMCCFVGFILGFLELCDHPLHSHRLILRALPPEVQAFYYDGARTAGVEKAISSYLTLVTMMIWGFEEHMHCTYAEWIKAQFLLGPCEGPKDNHRTCS